MSDRGLPTLIFFLSFVKFGVCGKMLSLAVKVSRRVEGIRRRSAFRPFAADEGPGVGLLDCEITCGSGSVLYSAG